VRSVKRIAVYAWIFVIFIVILSIYGFVYYLGVGGVQPLTWGAQGGYLINILGIVVLVVGVLLGREAIKARQGGNK
jgi:hypothetical protein